MPSASDASVKIIPFCVPLSSSLAGAAAAPSSPAADPGVGLVGTVTLRGQSAVVWFGWGALEEGDAGDFVTEAEGAVSVGNGKPPMGPLALSMPPIHRGGRPRPDEVPTTQLVGGSSEEDMMLGHQISARLAKRVGWPVFVSCSFGGRGEDSGGSATGGGDAASSTGYDDSMTQHASALAEREVSRILLHEKKLVG
ncbi:hypothetical protein ACHAXT_007885 [Thalassiosira profunda]